MEHRQGGIFEEPSINNPTAKVSFPISFPSVCNVVITESSFTGSANFYGTSVTAVSIDSFQYVSGSYGGNTVRFLALGV